MYFRESCPWECGNHCREVREKREKQSCKHKKKELRKFKNKQLLVCKKCEEVLDTE